MSTLTVRSLLLLASACHLVRASALPNNVGIFGGHRINITQVPSYAKLCYKDDETLVCGANIVHERFLVTAGHCAWLMEMDDPKHFGVVVGTDVNERGQGQKYELEKVFQNPNFTMTYGHPHSFDIDYDIAVIKLTKNLAFSERVKPIKMAEADAVLQDGSVLEAVGLGQTETSDDSKYLLAVAMKFFNHKKCREIFLKSNSSLTDRFICALGESGKGTCHGDSGGPLIFNGTLVGVTSYSSVGYCVHDGFPQAFTSISALRSFVDDNINNNL